MNSVIANSVVTALVLSWLLLMSAKAVTVDVAPRIAFAPADLTVTVRVQPNAENRNLIIEADGGDYRRTDVPLEGESAPISNRIEWRGIGAGDYIVTASVTSNVALLARDRTQVKILGRLE